MNVSNNYERPKDTFYPIFRDKSIGYLNRIKKPEVLCENTQPIVCIYAQKPKDDSKERQDYVLAIYYYLLLVFKIPNPDDGSKLNEYEFIDYRDINDMEFIEDKKLFCAKPTRLTLKYRGKELTLFIKKRKASTAFIFLRSLWGQHHELPKHFL